MIYLLKKWRREMEEIHMKKFRLNLIRTCKPEEFEEVIKFLFTQRKSRP